MTPDVQVNNDIAITIHQFETVFRKDPKGELVPVDLVYYSPKGDAKTQLIKEVRKLAQVHDIENVGDNIAAIRANRLWNVIKPNYEHWKTNNEMPTHGTPLAAWPGVTKSMADILRNAGLPTVEDVRDASEIVLNKTGIPNVLKIRDMAQKFLANEDSSKAAAQLSTLESENAELKAQMAEMMALMKEMQAEKAAEAPKGKKAA